MKQHAVEILAIIWLAVVATQYLLRYFVGAAIDMSPAYAAMLAVLMATLVIRARRAQSRRAKD